MVGFLLTLITNKICEVVERPDRLCVTGDDLVRLVRRTIMQRSISITRTHTCVQVTKQQSLLTPACIILLLILPASPIPVKILP